MNLENNFQNNIFLRPSSEVMNLQRLGSFHQSRLSFMRQLLRKINDEKWKFYSSEINLGKEDTGYILKKVYTQKRFYSLVCFIHNISDEERTDRVIAEKWDLTFCLFDGIPCKKDIKRLSINVPKQEDSRMSVKELALGRANKSLRIWSHVLNSLSKGRQPFLKLVEEVGYLMRTTAVYGSGKFGLLDREFIEDRSEFKAPFQVEMLSVYMLRSVIFDLVDFLSFKSGKENSCKLDQKFKKKLGIGNSTGLGMAPFLINHPILLNNWILAREEAIYKVRKIKKVSLDDKNLVIKLTKKFKNNIQKWITKDKIQFKNILNLKKDLDKTIFYLGLNKDTKFFWNNFYFFTKKNLSLEGQEALLSLMLEPYSYLVDILGKNMSVYKQKYFKIDANIKCIDLINIIEKKFNWSLKYDFGLNHNIEKFWYISEEKLEPRLGNRFKESGYEKEQPLSIAWDIKKLYEDLSTYDTNENISQFLINNDNHRHIVLRILETKDYKYSNIRENILSSEVRAIDLLRCKLSFFGANKFDPLSDRWIRISMYQGAPLPDELVDNYDDFWIY